jgi:hypothetical protein
MAKKILFLTMAADGLTACKSDVEKVCAKMADIAANDPKSDELGKKMKAEMTDTAACTSKLEKQKAEKPEAFAKLVPCVDGVDNTEGLIGCLFEAAK